MFAEALEDISGAQVQQIHRLVREVQQYRRNAEKLRMEVRSLRNSVR